MEYTQENVLEILDSNDGYLKLKEEAKNNTQLREILKKIKSENPSSGDTFSIVSDALCMAIDSDFFPNRGQETKYEILIQYLDMPKGISDKMNEESLKKVISTIERFIEISTLSQEKLDILKMKMKILYVKSLIIEN